MAGVELGGVRTALIVPMLKDNDLIGGFGLARQEVRPFTDKQVELVTNFAAQAVIAIENARLLKELRERTEQVEAQSRELVILNQQLEQRVTDQVDEIERMSRLRRFLPPQVADLIVASGSERQLESHRREITALFCDLRGFTGFTESADAEDAAPLATAQPNSVTGTRCGFPNGNKEVALKLGARYRSGGWYARPGVDLSGIRGARNSEHTSRRRQARSTVYGTGGTLLPGRLR